MGIDLSLAEVLKNPSEPVDWLVVVGAVVAVVVKRRNSAGAAAESIADIRCPVRGAAVK